MSLSVNAQIILIDQYNALKAQSEELALQMEKIKNMLIDANPEGATLGEHKLIRVKGRVNYAKLEKVFPQSSNPDLYTTSVVLDKTKVEAQLAPTVLDAYRATPTYQIR